jgi:hypothetical protein
MQAMESFMQSLPVSSIQNEQIEFFLQSEDPPQLQPGAFNSLAIPQVSPRAAYQDYVSPVLEQQLGFQLERLDSDYGGADLYRAQNNQGVEFYMSLVKLKLGSGAFVVLWQTDPRSQG